MNKILVTGGAGFLGSHVCEYFRKLGWEVIAYDNFTKGELSRTKYKVDECRQYMRQFLIGLGVTIVEKDIRNYEDLLESCQGCDFIVHTAAQPAITISWEDPLLDFTTNVMGTLNVLDAARALKIPVVSCATIHVYGNDLINSIVEETGSSLKVIKDFKYECGGGIDEQFPIAVGDMTPLHASKIAGDTYVRAYIDSFKIQAASFRLSGIYGTRQFGAEDHGWVANFCIRSAMKQPITIFGSGKQVRDIIYASDVANACECFFKTRESGVYNIGGGIENAISLLDCINLISERTEGYRDLTFAPARYGDLKYFVCDISKAKNHLGWEPKVQFNQGVPMLLDWVKTNKELFQINAN